jgi:N-acetylmuramoyl-L-alanine amidase
VGSAGLARSPVAGSPRPASHPAVSPSAASPSSSPPALLLAGKIVGIDPGHNGGNFTDPAAIGRLIWNGTGWETCDTTGTTTDGGYTEAQFNFNDAALLVTARFQQQVAAALTAAIVRFLG